MQIEGVYTPNTAGSMSTKFDVVIYTLNLQMDILYLSIYLYLDILCLHLTNTDMCHSPSLVFRASCRYP
jgi:hypothetical protein